MPLLHIFDYNYLQTVQSRLKKLERKKVESFEGNLIIGIYHLKNNRFDEAYKYFQKLEKNFVSKLKLNTGMLTSKSFLRIS